MIKGEFSALCRRVWQNENPLYFPFLLKLNYPKTETKCEPQYSPEQYALQCWGLIFQLSYKWLTSNYLQYLKKCCFRQLQKSPFLPNAVFLVKICITGPFGANFVWFLSMSHWWCLFSVVLDNTPGRAKSYSFIQNRLVCTPRPFHLVAISLRAVSATKSPIHQPLSCAAMKCERECKRREA